MPQLLGMLATDSSSAETLSGESLWLKRAALPKATPPSGAAYKEGLQIPWRGWLTAGPLPQWGPSEEPHQCQSFHKLRWVTPLLQPHLLHRSAASPSAHRCRPWALSTKLPALRSLSPLQTSGNQSCPETWRLGFELGLCLFLTLGLGVNFIPSKMGIIKNTP